MANEEQSPPHIAAKSKSELPMDIVMDVVEDGILVVDENYQVRFANSVMWQRPPKDNEVLEGRRCYEVFENRDSPCHLPLWECPLPRVFQNGMSTAVVHPDYPPTAAVTSKQHVKIAMHPLRDHQGNIIAAIEMRRNVSAERELENHILRGHHHLQALDRISSAVSGLWDLDAILKVSLDSALEIVSGAIGGILLLEKDTQRLRYRVYRGLSAKYVEQMQMSLGEGIAGRAAQTAEPILVEDISRDPRTAYPDLVSTEGLKGFASVPLKAKETVVGVMNIASHSPGQFGTDDLYLLDSIGCQVGTAIEQAKLYQRLARGRERYQALLQHALTAQENERKRVARELHDETSQAITSLALNLQALGSLAEMRGITDDEFARAFRKTQSLAVYAGNEIVRLMKELRPTLLDELGLAAAVNRYARDILEPLGIEVEAEFKGMDERRVPSEIEVTLFRISQGVIGNIREHSGASHVHIELEATDRECILQIRDDGKGFDVGKITNVDASGRGAGLFIMRERANLVGGTANVISQLEDGTEAIIRVPLAEDSGDGED